MFEAIRRRWAEARADVAGKAAEDILLRYDRMDPNSQYFVASAFTSVLSDLENQFGPQSEWSNDRKKAVAKDIMVSSREAHAARGGSLRVETSRLGAHGGALLSLYLELQALPGARAQSVIAAIDRWRATVR